MSVPASRRPRPDSAILTFLIADIRGYTAFTRTAGDEAAARLAATFAEIVREGVEALGGDVIELRGDEALAVFGSARSALRAAVELQQVFADEYAIDPALPMRVGIGLDAGEAVPVEGGYRGAALNLAARLCSAASAGEILASEGVVHLAGTVDGLATRPRDGLELKGLPEPVRAFDIVVPARPTGLVRIPPQPDIPPELDPLGPLVGRDRDARWLRWAWRSARSGARTHRVLEGDAGSGRTRLAAEAAALAGRDGRRVLYASGSGERGSLEAAVAAAIGGPDPALLVLDDLELADDGGLAALDALHRAAGAPGGMAVLIGPADPPAALARMLRRLAGEGEARVLGPLDEEAVASILALYADDAESPLPSSAVAEASGGIPARVHALAAQWAQGEAARRLGGATSRAAEGRRDLRRLEAEVASNLVDLQLARERSRLLAPEPGASRWAEACPFMGLASFDTGDADVFFGRERLVAEMVGRLAGAPFLGIVGPSGSGKSSAMRAGLLPALEAGALPGSERWLRVVIRPGTEPLRELDRAVFAALDEPLRKRLSHGPDPIASALAVLPGEARLLVVVDQFEEVFTATADPGERAGFVASLVGAAGSGRAVVVVAVRADFYGRCTEFEELARLLGSAHVLVAPMGPDEYRRAIEGPARRAGLRVEPVLVDRLVADVTDQPGGLPLLSTALVELWQKRDRRSLRLAAYLETGGVSGAVARLAEAAYDRLTEAQRSMARSVFLRLASGGGEVVVRRRVPLSELDAATNETVRETLGVLTEERLVTVDEGTVEVAHEALLREWPRLVRWLEEDREGRRLRGHLAEAAREWAGAGRDPGELYRGARLASTLDWTAEHTLELNDLERQFVTESRMATERETKRQARTNRRLRALLAAALVALIVAVSAGGLAVVQRQAADQATADAQAQRVLAEKAATAADAQRLGAIALSTKDLDLSLLLARQGLALDDSAPVRADLLAALSRSPAAVRISRPLPGRPLGVVASADGRTLVVRNNGNAMAVIDTASGQTLYVHQGGPSDFAAIAADGTPFFVTAATQPTFTELRRDADAVARTVTWPMADAWSFGWAPDLTTIQAVTPDGRELLVYDSATLGVLRRIPAPAGMTFANVNGFEGGHLLVTETPGPVDPTPAYLSKPGIEAWFGPTGTVPITTYRVAQTGDSYSVSPDGSTLAVDNEPEPGHETLVDLRTGKSRQVNGQHTAQIDGSSFSPDGRLVLTGGDDLSVRAWDVATGALVQTLEGHNGRVFAPAVTDLDGKLTAWSVSLDGSMIAWDLSGDRRLGQSFPGASTVDAVAPIFDPTPAIAQSPDGRLLALGESDGAVILDASTHAVVRRIQTGSTDAPAVAAWSPDGTRIAVTGDGTHVVTLYDTATWQPVGGASLPGPAATRPARPHEAPLGPTDDGKRPNASRALGFSADSSRLVAGTDAGELLVWDARTGALLGPAIAMGGPVLGLAVDHAHGRVAVAFNPLGPDGTIAGGRAAVLAPGAPSPSFTVDVDGDYGHADAVAFSPDGRTLATGGGTGYVRLWDASSGTAVGRPVLAAAGWVTSIAWSSDGHELVTGGTDGTVRIIDVAADSVAGTLPGLDNQNVDAVFTRDGRRIVASYDSGTAFEWSTSVTDWAARACAVAGRTLTQAEWAQYLPGRPYKPACAP